MFNPNTHKRRSFDSCIHLIDNRLLFRVTFDADWCGAVSGASEKGDYRNKQVFSQMLINFPQIDSTGSHSPAGEMQSGRRENHQTFCQRNVHQIELLIRSIQSTVMAKLCAPIPTPGNKEGLSSVCFSVIFDGWRNPREMQLNELADWHKPISVWFS